MCSLLDAHPGASLTEEQRRGLTALYEELAVSYPKSSAVRRAPLDFKVGARAAVWGHGVWGGQWRGVHRAWLGVVGLWAGGGSCGKAIVWGVRIADHVAGEPGLPQRSGAHMQCISRSASCRRRCTEQH